MQNWHFKLKWYHTFDSIIYKKTRFIRFTHKEVTQEIRFATLEPSATKNPAIMARTISSILLLLVEWDSKPLKWLSTVLHSLKKEGFWLFDLLWSLLRSYSNLYSLTWELRGSSDFKILIYESYWFKFERIFCRDWISWSLKCLNKLPPVLNGLFVCGLFFTFGSSNLSLSLTGVFISKTPRSLDP